MEHGLAQAGLTETEVKEAAFASIPASASLHIDVHPGLFITSSEVAQELWVVELNAAIAALLEKASHPMTLELDRRAQELELKERYLARVRYRLLFKIRRRLRRI